MYQFELIDNPRKPNGDLGDKKCWNCERKTSVYIKISEELVHDCACSSNGSKCTPKQLSIVLCKSCLYDMIAMIDNMILGKCVGERMN